MVFFTLSISTTLSSLDQVAEIQSKHLGEDAIFFGILPYRYGDGPNKNKHYICISIYVYLYVYMYMNIIMYIYKWYKTPLLNQKTIWRVLMPLKSLRHDHDARKCEHLLFACFYIIRAHSILWRCTYLPQQVRSFHKSTEKHGTFPKIYHRHCAKQMKTQTYFGDAYL